jgi:hypothetical protein
VVTHEPPGNWEHADRAPFTYIDGVDAAIRAAQGCSGRPRDASRGRRRESLRRFHGLNGLLPTRHWNAATIQTSAGATSSAGSRLPTGRALI